MEFMYLTKHDFWGCVYRVSDPRSLPENLLVFVPHTKQIMKVYFSSLYCVFADDKSDSIILHVSFTREKPPRRRETRGAKYFQLKSCL